MTTIDCHAPKCPTCGGLRWVPDGSDDAERCPDCTPIYMPPECKEAARSVLNKPDARDARIAALEADHTESEKVLIEAVNRLADARELALKALRDVRRSYLNRIQDAIAALESES